MRYGAIGQHGFESKRRKGLFNELLGHEQTCKPAFNIPGHASQISKHRQLFLRDFRSKPKGATDAEVTFTTRASSSTVPAHAMDQKTIRSLRELTARTLEFLSSALSKVTYIDLQQAYGERFRFC
jgi:hypothetical protein